MSRTAIYQALSLKSRPSGESNSEVTLLTAEEGIITATVFGGAKSKLRSHTSPYNSGQVWIYRDPAKDYRKLSDFEVKSWRPGLRELYDRTMAATAIADTILNSHGGGGDWKEVLSLAEKALDTLETADEEKCERILVRFLWRWVEFLGIWGTELQKQGQSSEKTGTELQKQGQSSEKKGTELQKQGQSSEKTETELQKQGQSSEKTGTELQKQGQSSEKTGTELQKQGQSSEKKGTELQKQGQSSEKTGTELQKQGQSSEKTGTELKICPSKAQLTAILAEAIGKYLPTWDW